MLPYDINIIFIHQATDVNHLLKVMQLVMLEMGFKCSKYAQRAYIPNARRM